jgi:hypothetical protein
LFIVWVVFGLCSHDRGQYFVGCLAFCVAIAFVPIVTNLVKKRRTDTPTWAAFGLAVLLFALLFVPSGVWQKLFIRQMASSPRAGDLFAYAAYDRDCRTLKAMLSHGVSIGATDHSEWRTALHAAAIAGDLRNIQFLVSNGANVNALDRAGDSPAELAASRGHPECATFLQEHGGRRFVETKPGIGKRFRTRCEMTSRR